jgi:hypothetical protein
MTTSTAITDLMIARLEEIEEARAADRKEAHKYIRAKLENTFDKSFLNTIETGTHEVVERERNLKTHHRFTGRGSLTLLANTAHFVDDNPNGRVAVALGDSPVAAETAAASLPGTPDHRRIHAMSDLIDFFVEWDASQGLDGE